ncbi:GYF domain-containing protein, putative [Babesia ovis]|uniref:GYF domain-containing protein, putative n=1 Tax=Babesia ovis TaxID=5869 RepID=A0A9W5TCU7_BABOV|nr:GYF domain-containing protein, putative [Babesia ovis]
MFHPRPFGGIANLFSKSAKGEQEGRNEGQVTSAPETGGGNVDAPNQKRSAPLRQNAPNDGKSMSLNRGSDHRRSMEDTRSHKDQKPFGDSKYSAEGKLFSDRKFFPGSKPLPEPKHFGESKNFPDLKLLAEPKGFDDMKLSQPRPTGDMVSMPVEVAQPLTKIEIPPNAAQLAATQGLFDKLYLVQLMMTLERIFKEKGVSMCAMDPPKFKFVESHAPNQHTNGPRESGRVPREVISSLYGSGSQSLFEIGEPNRKSMDIVSGHRRNYFEQRVPKGKESFRLGREGYDAPDYSKRGDIHDVDPHLGDVHNRWKGYDDHMRPDHRFGFDKYKQNDGFDPLDDERPLQFEGIEHLNHPGPGFHGRSGGLQPESESSLLSVIQAQRRQERLDMADRFHPFDGVQNRRADDLMSMSMDRSSHQRGSADVRMPKSNMMNDGFGTSQSSSQRLLHYTAKATQPWSGGADVPTWKSPPTNPVKATNVFDSPELKGNDQRLSFLERLLDKSFDSPDTNMETSILDTAVEFQKVMNLASDQHDLQHHGHVSAQSQPTVKPHQAKSKSHSKQQTPPKAQPQAKPQLQSKQPAKAKTQPQIKVQPPQTEKVPTQPSSQPPMALQPANMPPIQGSSQMPVSSSGPLPHPIQAPEPQTISLHWQYKDFHGVVHGPFPSSQMYKWYMNNFFNPNLQMRYNENMPWTALKDLYPHNYDAFLENPVGYKAEGSKPAPTQKMTEKSLAAPQLPTAVQGVEGVSSKDTIQANEAVRASSVRWNKPEDLKVDSLLEIMEKQMRQSVPQVTSNASAPPAATKPTPGWKVSDVAASTVSLASDDFPSLALAAETTSKSKKKTGVTSGSQQHQQSTMSLKAFMKHQAQNAESMRGIHPKESFARKLMGDNK